MEFTKMIKKIILAGKGGQGVKYISTKLANILIEKGFEVSLTFTYDAAIKGGDIFSNIIYSDESIENPIIEKADLLVSLSEINQEFNAEKEIKVSEVEGERLNETALGMILEELVL
jgi:2-oxoglutarate ferredoxin oxidoreductase subunit gamma